MRKSQTQGCILYATVVGVSHFAMRKKIYIISSRTRTTCTNLKRKESVITVCKNSSEIVIRPVVRTNISYRWRGSLLYETFENWRPNNIVSVPVNRYAVFICIVFTLELLYTYNYNIVIGNIQLYKYFACIMNNNLRYTIHAYSILRY